MLHKKSCCILVAVIVVCMMTNALASEFFQGKENIVQLEPMPIQTKSLNEAFPFIAFSLDSSTLEKRLSDCKSYDEIQKILLESGIKPLYAPDNGNHKQASFITLDFPSPICGYDGVSLVSYAWNEYENVVYVFLTNDEESVFIDALSDFGFTDFEEGLYTGVELRFSNDKKLVWLAESPSSSRVPEFSSIRWYNLIQRKFDLAYVANGVNGDFEDYAIRVCSTIDNFTDGILPENNTFLINKTVFIEYYDGTPPKEIYSEVLNYGIIQGQYCISQLEK